MSTTSNIGNCNIHVTQHAYKRARERFSWNAGTIERMSKKAFNKGLKRDDAKGRLKRYMDDVSEEYKGGSYLRMHGETIFIFSNHSLVTVWQLPMEYRSLARVFHKKNCNTTT